MTYQKCSRCKLQARESSKAFYKRTSISFKIPFICRKCTRMIACIKHPDFRPYEVKPNKRIYKPPKPKIKSIEALGLPNEINELHALHGKLSAPFLQRRLKMGFKEAERIVKLIEEYIK